MSSAAQMLQMRDKMFDALDTNEDGVVDANELAAASKKGSESKGTGKSDDLFSKIDSDGDGKISRAESDAFKQKMSDQMKGTMLQIQENGVSASDGTQSGEDDMFTKLDTNGDGSLDKAEFEAGRKAHGHGKPPSPEEMLSKLDTDGDGAISKAEFEAAPKPPGHGGPPDLAEMLTKLDTDGDGKITKAEFEAGAPASASSTTSSTSSSSSTDKTSDATSTLLNLLKKIEDDSDASKKTSRDQMMAFLLKLQETGAVAA
jgi:Ca2+-binding EF-hand superfamily protein